MKKLFQTAFLAGVLGLCFVSCSKKDEKISPSPTPTNRYYFEFNLDGKAVKMASQEPQFTVLSGNVGGYQTPSANVFFPSIRLTFDFPNPALDADVKALAGKRLKFGYAWDGARAALAYEDSSAGETFFDNYDTTGAYYVDISKVSYSKRDTILGMPFDIYEVSGTCKAKLEDYLGNSKNLSDGKFNMLVSRPLTDTE